MGKEDNREVTHGESSRATAKKAMLPLERALFTLILSPEAPLSPSRKNHHNITTITIFMPASPSKVHCPVEKLLE